jgi:hypothetical protein
MSGAQEKIIKEEHQTFTRLFGQPRIKIEISCPNIKKPQHW